MAVEAGLQAVAAAPAETAAGDLGPAAQAATAVARVGEATSRTSEPHEEGQQAGIEAALSDPGRDGAREIDEAAAAGLDGEGGAGLAKHSRRIANAAGRGAFSAASACAGR